MTDPHEDLVEAVARRLASNNLYEYTAFLSDARDIIALIAERTKDATPEMLGAFASLMSHDRAFEAWHHLHRISALWPKEK